MKWGLQLMPDLDANPRGKPIELERMFAAAKNFPSVNTSRSGIWATTWEARSISRLESMSWTESGPPASRSARSSERVPPDHGRRRG